MRPKLFRTVLLGLTFLASEARSQSVTLQKPLSQDADLPAAMARLARQAIDSYRNSDREKYLDDLFRLQIVVGRYDDAATSLRALKKLRAESGSSPPALIYRRWELYCQAKVEHLKNLRPFADGFQLLADETLRALDDKSAYQFLYSLGTPLDYLQRAWTQALESEGAKTAIELSSAIELARKYLAATAFGEIHILLSKLMDADDRRRYIVDDPVQVRSPDGATICALIVRPRRAPERGPTLLQFTIYADPWVTRDDARLTVANGYIAAVGFTRGKLCSPDRPVPIEHDGADAAALVDWISRQPWSDGRVGMYGGSYNGFAQWATAKHAPKALKAIMPSVSFSPGTDFPMEGNVFQTYGFPWPFYTTNNKTLDKETYFDGARWNRLQRSWYLSGRAYRELDQLDGTPNPIFDRWLQHPAYDAYWHGVIPYREEFGKIRIPVLTTTGYYDSGQIGALHYFTEHHRYRPGAEHYLVIGPYDHVRGQIGTIDALGGMFRVLRGYELDPSAQLDILALRYAWFNYLFKGAPKPALLRDTVNYQVMGTNRWKHAPSLEAMGRAKRFYLDPGSARAMDRKPPRTMSRTQTIDLADRSDVARFSPEGWMIDEGLDDWNIVNDATNIANSIAYVSESFANPPEISGLFSGQLAFVANKKDFDFSVTLFELTAKGQYMHLSHVWQRASYASDRTRRNLLRPGTRTMMAFRAGRLTSRQFQPGSRLVVVVAILKQPGEQINYGSGKEVSDETVADAGVPLAITWFGDSFVDVPVADTVHSGHAPRN